MFKCIIQFKLNKDFERRRTKKFLWKFTDVNAVSFTPPYLTCYINYLFVSVVCVLSDIPKKSRFPVWNDLQLCLTARQADRVKIK